jgi:MoaA/NifB/PqqE/SkfB family radical SAM enzyme/SAM-dependent methyltransferase
MIRPRALIKVGYTCNNHCSFCHTLDARETTASDEDVIRKVNRAADLGFAMVVFSGGEPTLRRELGAWCRHARARGLATGLVTNGRVLAYPLVADRMVADGLAYVHLSLHAGSAAIHDQMTHAPAWGQTLQAVRNLSGRGLELTAACVVTRENLGHLRGVVDLLAPFGDVRIKLSLVEPKGGALAQFDAIVPPIGDAAHAVADALTYARTLLPETLLAHENVPLCLLDGWTHLATDLRRHGFTHMVEAWECDFCPVDEANRVHPEVCRDCVRRGHCPGLFAAYAARRGTAEIGPPRAGPRSNSFTYTAAREVLWPPATPCPLLTSGTRPFDPGRTLFLRQGARLQLCTTASRDFTDSEIRAAKLDGGQLYLDVSDKPAPDDFGADLRKLVRLAECDACPANDGCPGGYEPASADVFTLDEARLTEHLAALRGDVLDIGCGAGRYSGALAVAATKGLLRYVGVDPDSAALARLAARAPWATLHQQQAHTFETGQAQWDAVLLINSLNHLAEPQTLLATLAVALRPGGTLLVADDVPFGLVRTVAQARRAEEGPARFEHLRNHTAADAARLLSRVPLTITFINDADRRTSNQWLIGCIKAAA